MCRKLVGEREREKKMADASRNSKYICRLPPYYSIETLDHIQYLGNRARFMFTVLEQQFEYHFKPTSVARQYEIAQYMSVTEQSNAVTGNAVMSNAVTSDALTSNAVRSEEEMSTE